MAEHDEIVKRAAEARFLAKVEKQLTEDGCWLWAGGKVTGGYGTFWNGKKLQRAHRWAYEHWRGPIADGLEIDHLCRTTGCVNPAHLEAVAAKLNCLRARNAQARKTHCPKGHPLSGDNLVEYKAQQGWRECLTCKKEGNDQQRAERLEERKRRENPDHVCGYRTKYEELQATFDEQVAAARKEAREEALEEAAKAICGWCTAGEILRDLDYLHLRPYADAPGFRCLGKCRAWPIHALRSKPKGPA